MSRLRVLTVAIALLPSLLFCRPAFAESDAALKGRIADTKARFKQASSAMSKASVGAIEANFYLVDKLESGEKLDSFDQGMASATAGQHQDKANCKGMIAGLLCEIDTQIAEATGAKPTADDCANTPDTEACVKAKLEELIKKLNKPE
jgi:hypothetical protein